MKLTEIAKASQLAARLELLQKFHKNATGRGDPLIWIRDYDRCESDTMCVSVNQGRLRSLLDYEIMAVVEQLKELGIDV